jgi:hypothetical protein
MPVHRKLTGQSGLGLLSLLVAAALLSILSMAFMAYFKSMFQAEKVMAKRSDLSDIRRYIATRMSCPVTMPVRAPECANNSWIQILAADGTVLIARPNQATAPWSYTTMSNKYLLRSRCVDCVACPNGKRISVEAAEVTNDSVWSDLFHTIPIACIVPP